MTFGDWVLFNNWVENKREEERYDDYLYSDIILYI
jgi:hypothetical protein